jgi:hypothetical protein
MARPKKSFPSYSHHKPTNTARAWVNGRWVQLGRYNSPESREAYARLCAQLAGSPTPAPVVPPADPAGLSVNEVLIAFWRYAEQHYRRADGTPTNELPQYRYTFRPVRELVGHTPAKEFGPVALKSIRAAMVRKGWCRKLVNQRVGRVRRVFKWAASEQLVPVAVYQSLTTVAGLQKGRTAAAERAPVLPVDEAAGVRQVVAHPTAEGPLRGWQIEHARSSAAGLAWADEPPPHPAEARAGGRKPDDIIGLDSRGRTDRVAEPDRRLGPRGPDLDPERPAPTERDRSAGDLSGPDHSVPRSESDAEPQTVLGLRLLGRPPPVVEVPTARTAHRKLRLTRWIIAKSTAVRKSSRQQRLVQALS